MWMIIFWPFRNSWNDIHTSSPTQRIDLFNIICMKPLLQIAIVNIFAYKYIPKMVNEFLDISTIKYQTKEAYNFKRSIKMYTNDNLISLHLSTL